MESRWWCPRTARRWPAGEPAELLRPLLRRTTVSSIGGYRAGFPRRWISIQAQRRRQMLTAAWQEYLKDTDLYIGASDTNVHAATGHPAVVVPIGFGIRAAGRGGGGGGRGGRGADSTAAPAPPPVAIPAADLRADRRELVPRRRDRLGGAQVSGQYGVASRAPEAGVAFVIATRSVPGVAITNCSCWTRGALTAESPAASQRACTPARPSRRCNGETLHDLSRPSCRLHCDETRNTSYRRRRARSPARQR